MMWDLCLINVHLLNKSLLGIIIIRGFPNNKDNNLSIKKERS